MNACLPSRAAKLLLTILTVILTTAGQVGPGVAAEVPVLTLPPVTLTAFAELPALKTLKVTPALKDSATTVDKAANAKGVMKLLGVQLTAAQKKFLNEHKFLLIPKRATRFKGTMGNGWEWDEMLGMFDEVGGSESEAERKPENARRLRPTSCSTPFTNILKTRWNTWKDST